MPDSESTPIIISAMQIEADEVSTRVAHIMEAFNRFVECNPFNDMEFSLDSYYISETCYTIPEIYPVATLSLPLEYRWRQMSSQDHISRATARNYFEFQRARIARKYKHHTPETSKLDKRHRTKASLNRGWQEFKWKISTILERWTYHSPEMGE
ncbi:hypothetical protein BDD12DRAFT_890007 [Trichophaea hybrida]|nr:hypothetical protein BDD12DRAFT_890007 [Trichophaea hybrida]